MNLGKRPYTAENASYFCFLPKIRLVLASFWIFLIPVAVIGFQWIALQASSQNPTETFEVASQKISLDKSLNIREAKLYGSRQQPVSYIEAGIPVKDSNESVAIHLNDFEDNQNKNSHQNSIHHEVMAISQDQGVIAKTTIEFLPRADIDEDEDVDTYDYLRFKKKPFDINRDGLVNVDDQRDFKTWLGWRRYHLIGWKKFQ